MAKLWKRAVAFATLMAVLDGEAIIAFVAKAIRCAASHEPSKTGEACGPNDHVETERILPPSLPPVPPPSPLPLVLTNRRVHEEPTLPRSRFIAVPPIPQIVQAVYSAM